ncbi:MAG: PAS domain S-box protein [Gammaproteobacteria bacterium]|nr:PAS domain S-box protein [Gammaproteobacteria bacterium]
MEQNALQHSQGVWGSMLLVLLVLGLYFVYTRSSFDHSVHYAYLEQLEKLSETGSSYTAELLKLNYERGRNLDQSTEIAKRFAQDAGEFADLPDWITTEERTGLQKVAEQLQQQVQQWIDSGERFSRSRSAYLNSLKYLSTLHKTMDQLLNEEEVNEDAESIRLIEEFLELVDHVEIVLIFPEESNRRIGEKLKQFYLSLEQYHPDFVVFLNLIRNGTVHLQMIVTHTREAQQWLQQSLKIADQQHLSELQQQYRALYETFQNQQDLKMRWLEMVAAVMIAGILLVLERLRRARVALRAWNHRLQHEVERRTVQLQQAQQEADRVVEYAADPLLVVDLENRVGRYNQAALGLFGATRKILHQPVNDLFYQLKRDVADGFPYEEEQWVINDQDALVPVLLSTSELVGEEGESLGQVWSLRDISLVKQLYADIQSYQSAIDQMMMVTISGVDGVIRYANSLYLETTGYQQQEVIGQKHSLLNSGYHPKSFWAEFWRVISSNQVWHGEICNRNKKGELFWSDSSISPMFNVEGNKTGYLAVRIDVTEQLEYRKERERQAYEGGVEEISSSILHNIGNTIMGAEHQAVEVQKRIHGLLRVTQYLHKLSQSEPLPNGEGGRLEKLAKTLEQFVHYGEQTIKKQVSTFSHIEGIIEAQRKVVQGGVWLSRFEINEALADVVQLMENVLEKYNTTIHLNIESAPELVTLPKSPFQQMLANLIKNSCEAIGEKMEKSGPMDGEVHLSIETMERGEQFTIQVSDNGVGISEKVLQKLFTRGVTTKESGTGQGLHSMALFVQSLDGSLSVDSEGLGLGAQFTVVLPVEFNDTGSEG